MIQLFILLLSLSGSSFSRAPQWHPAPPTTCVIGQDMSERCHRGRSINPVIRDKRALRDDQ
jgi:hypothetical protein